MTQSFLSSDQETCGDLQGRGEGLSPLRVEGDSLGCRLLDHLVRPQKERWRDRQAERLGGLEVDYQLEGFRPDDR